MGAYNFQPRFVPFVLDGTKTHTIRGNRRHPDKPGSTAYLFTGLRRKNPQRLFSAPVVKVESITITENYDVIIDDVLLTPDECDALAWRDGFRPPFTGDPREGLGYRGCFELMCKFWGAGGTEQKKSSGSPHAVPFHGHVIHWDYSRRVEAARA